MLSRFASTAIVTGPILLVIGIVSPVLGLNSVGPLAGLGLALLLAGLIVPILLTDRAYIKQQCRSLLSNCLMKIKTDPWNRNLINLILWAGFICITARMFYLVIWEMMLPGLSEWALADVMISFAFAIALFAVIFFTPLNAIAKEFVKTS